VVLRFRESFIRSMIGDIDGQRTRFSISVRVPLFFPQDMWQSIEIINTPTIDKEFLLVASNVLACIPYEPQA
jgi:hypothetical protein